MQMVVELAPNRDDTQAPRELAVVIAGLLCAAGGALTFATSILPPPAVDSEIAIRAIGLVSLSAGLVLLAWRPRLGELPLAELGVLSTVLITIAAHEGRVGGSTGGYEMLYLWVALYAFYFLRLGTALLEVALIGVAFAWLLSSKSESDQATTEWLVTMTTLLVAGLIVARIRIQLYRLVAELRERVRHDGLTGVLNREALEERVAAERSRAHRDRSPLSLLAIDIDDFKELNDTLGHARGDSVLREVALALRTSTRGHDVVARTGGDEFVVLLPGADEPAARTVADGLRKQVSRALEGENDGVTISVGVATADGPIPAFETLLASADAAMYTGKRAGGDRVSARAEIVRP